MSLSSLADEGFPVDAEDLDPWPTPESLGPRILLSEVRDTLETQEADAPIAANFRNQDKFDPDAPPPGYLQRAANLSEIQFLLADAIARVPDGSVFDFHKKVRSTIGKLVSEYPHEPEARIRARLEELGWFFIRKEISRRLLIKRETYELTQTATYDNIAGVNDLWPALKRQLQSATAKTGKKSELAKFLHVDLTRVSQWLTDKKSAREPGAEYALQMQAWVREQGEPTK